MAIKIDAETLRTNAGTLDGYRTTHDTNIQSIKTLITGMCGTDVFDGATSKAYLDRLESYKTAMEQFSEMIQEFADNLRTIAQSFADTDTELANQLK